MPLYEYECPQCGEWAEDIRKFAHRDKTRKCSRGHRMERMASLPYVRPEGMYGEHPIFGRCVKNDSDSPWEGTGVEPPDLPRPGYKQRKIQVDLPSKTNVPANH